jgi:hypothetical protein
MWVVGDQGCLGSALMRGRSDLAHRSSRATEGHRGQRRLPTSEMKVYTEWRMAIISRRMSIKAIKWPTSTSSSLPEMRRPGARA